jgi:signal transduction histidine kinase
MKPEVKIHNNGKIIKEEDAEAIFDKFYQSRNQNIRNARKTHKDTDNFLVTKY